MRRFSEDTTNGNLSREDFTALLKKLNQTQFDFMIVDLDVALTLARMAVTNPDELVGAQIPLSYPYYKRYAEMHETDVPTWCFSRIK